MVETKRPQRRIVDVDALMLRTLELEGLLGFHCRLLERHPAPDSVVGECFIRSDELLPLVHDPRSGIKAIVTNGSIAGYAVFGRPELFPSLAELGIEVDEDALFIGALYIVPDAREEKLDVDLLVAVMEFARAQGYDTVAAVCSLEEGTDPEPMAGLLAAAGFQVAEGIDGECLATTTLKAWDGEEADL